MKKTNIEDEVWQTVQALNKAWTSGNVDALKNYFHKDMVAITATDKERLEGREVWAVADQFSAYPQ